MSSVVPSFTPPPLQQRAIVSSPLPVLLPVNLQQPPPPLPPIPYAQPDLPPFSTPPTAPSPADKRFSTPPPMESFNALSMADSAAFVDPNGSNPGRNSFSAPSRGDQGFEAPVGTFEAGVGAGGYHSGGFEEAALHQEQQENESRGPLPSFQPSPEGAFGMVGDQGHFEIGTFSIQDVNGAGESAGGKGRKITRQPSTEDGDEENEDDDWPVDSAGGD